ncbi:DNA-binding bromodomain-containing protein [Actinidia rufa]|uniref:DNA-binding bromodomain-containing protein n=1 Tax=Actinidia rufa TaxID=165716 RepID=A0A7J0GP60_9ERIC|nr:DNA-binding bromodomain-containing protein [Actinidia rufa]
MSHIVKRKKKGRPSKADLARRAAAAAETQESDDRGGGRRIRRRNGRYNFDIDDLIDEEDEENEQRREKKLKLLLKDGSESATSRTRRVLHAPAASGSSPEHGDGDEVNKRKAGSKVAEVAYSVPETPSDPQQGLSLPGKKLLDLILDKLQKKDTYGVYAELVDPEELPDYHDVIEHPMDFATVRKKLRNGSSVEILDIPMQYPDEAPTFDGRPDSKAFIDWVREMNRFFDWHKLSDDRKVRFAKLKLISRAKFFWQSTDAQRRKPIIDGTEMNRSLE